MPKGLQTVPADYPVDDVIAIINRDGAVIIADLFPKAHIEQLDKEVVPLLDALPYGTIAEEELLDDFFGARTKRLTNLVANSPMFRNEFLDNDRILRYIDAMMLPYAESYWLCTGHVVDIHSEQKAQPLHRDLENYPHFRKAGRYAPEVMTNCIVPLTEFTADNGATRVIPGSNRWDDFDDRGSPEQTVAAELDLGSALLISGKVVHGGGANVTGDRRRALLLAYNLGYLTPEEAHPFTVPLDIARSLSPRAQQLIGFRSFCNEGHGTMWGVNFKELGDHLGLVE